MVQPSNLDAFLNRHRHQLVSSGIPKHLWSVLNRKLEHQTFDAGTVFRLVRIEYEEQRQTHEPLWGLQAMSEIKHTDSNAIYIIDHAWTFRVSEAKNQLIQSDTLRNRMNNILGLSGKTDRVENAEQIFWHVWKVCNMYSVPNAENIEDRLPIWYVMDEIGTAVVHRDEPNCRIVPFFHLKDQVIYSLMFPIKDIDKDSIISRDFAEGVTGETERKAALLPWIPSSFENFSTKPEMPGPAYYLAGHVEETLPDLGKLRPFVPKDKYKVFSEYSLIHKYLTDSKFELVNNETEADILWYTKHFKQFSQLSPEKFVNQFPFEFVLTIKDLLCLTCRRLKNAHWHPITYNLKTEIGNFVKYFQEREQSNQDNFWIIKPYNLARNLDTHITNNLDYIMRLPITGPKIVQKYITSPVLFHRPECQSHVKFDLRYIILVRQVRPLQAFVHKQFFLRFANKQFDLNEFHIYDKHFTVMNYEDLPIKQMLCEEFKQKWQQMYPDQQWKLVEKSIFIMLKEVLEGAVLEAPPCGIAHSPQSRAMYAADIMLEWGKNRVINPKILEINWTPDCKRACEFYPNFFNDIFKLLFLGEQSNVFYKL